MKWVQVPTRGGGGEGRNEIVNRASPPGQLTFLKRELYGFVDDEICGLGMDIGMHLKGVLDCNILLSATWLYMMRVVL